MIKKIVVSLWLVFHVFLVSVFPNGTTYIREKYSSFILPYVNALSLNYAWSFYAPNPETAMYIEYDVEKGGEGFKYLPTETYLWPPEKQGYLDFQHVRRHTNMGYLVQFRDWIDKMFVPWVCRKTPNATGVTVKMVFIRVPTLEEVQNGAPIFDPDMFLSQRLGWGSCSGETP